MSRKNPILADAIAMIRNAGFEPRVVEHKHFKVCWLDQHGRMQMLVISRSPSHWNAHKRSRAVLKRLLKTSNRGDQHEVSYLMQR